MITERLLDTASRVPTDNLYKFRALVGSVVFVLSFASVGLLYYQRMQVQVQLTVSIRRQVELLTASNAEASRALVLSEQRRLVEARQMWRTADSLKALADSHKRALVPMREEYDRIGIMWTMLPILAALIGVLALQVTHKSFEDWQRLHQALQDRLLLAQVEGAELELAQLRASMKPPSVPIELVASPPSSSTESSAPPSAT